MKAISADANVSWNKNLVNGMKLGLSAQFTFRADENLVFLDFETLVSTVFVC